jgi:hypothetical protein
MEMTVKTDTGIRIFGLGTLERPGENGETRSGRKVHNDDRLDLSVTATLKNI